MFVLIAVLFVNACLAGTIPATPENITVTFLTPTAVRVSWQTQIDLKAHPIEKYIVTYKPTDDSYRVVQDVAGSSEAIVLDRLLPSTQYSLVVTAIWQGRKYRSRGQIKFKTLDLPKNTSQQDFPPGIYGNGSNGGRNGSNNGSIFGDDVTSTATNILTHGTTRELPTIRGVEIGIVLIVLMVWAGAIALFFNRWGKIRMLLPYQPDYKHEQLKVPGTGVCSASGCNGQHSHQYNHYFLFNPCTTLTKRLKWALSRDLTDETFPTFTSLSPADLAPAPDPALAALAAPTVPASDLWLLVGPAPRTKQCLPRCEGCASSAAVSAASSHGHGHSHGTPVNTYVRGPSVDNQSIVGANVLENVDSLDAGEANGDDNIEVEGEDVPDKDREDQQLLQRAKEPVHRILPLQAAGAMKQRKFAQQRGILKNSQERTFVEEDEVLEAKKQLILRRRRLFSHYRQYDQWRRRQFSYDPSYFRPPPLPPRALGCADHHLGTITDANPSASAGRRRRQYRRQYSCADRSREGSHDSRGSSTMQLQLQKYHSMVASDTIHTESSVLNHSNYSEPASHIHMLAEEHSTSISERCTRSRINSAIFVSSEGRGFDSIEFLRRHGSQSVLCRKAKSAENITDNGRRKSLRPWRTDDESCKQQHLSQDSNDIELKECGGAGGELLRLPVIHDGKQTPTAVSSLLARSAAITTANMIVGSISLEAPPPYMQDDEGDTLSTAALIHSDADAVVHESQDSAETVEELVHVPLLASATATASVSASSSPSIAIEAKPRVLVHQRSSTASSSPHSSPKNLGSLGLKIVKPKISAVPMVSVSGPSPPIEKPPLAECL
ncbi:LOW QUALITY PROTEIN: uncharacterized protein Dere_GG21059 [Drosophila erecta]|uniref:Fibronectin type-III domain-containing protein n=1 Tax=Drosophila erecta TaxID=7220 RepID=B3NLI8_DROER|nr:LOW QUALITY PROTEIN: uncharacterized protein Dere_GG21059 [Drosophila erecta]